MKEVKRYQCEYCNALYLSRSDADKCESSHSTEMVRVLQRHYEGETEPLVLIVSFMSSKNGVCQHRYIRSDYVLNDNIPDRR